MFAVTLGVLALIQGCDQGDTEIIRYDTSSVGSYHYLLELDYFDEDENEVLTLFLDQSLQTKGFRNCIWSDINTTELCGLDIAGWRPWGSKIWINLNLRISDANRILTGRVFNDKASGKIIFSGYGGESEIGSFQIHRDLK